MSYGHAYSYRVVMTRMERLADQYGGVAKAAKALKMNSRVYRKLMKGTHQDPPTRLLKRIGIKRAIRWQTVSEDIP